MSSAIGSINNVKIFVLYLLQNINYPVDFVTINDIVMQTDYVMYLDFAVAFNSLLDSGLIEKVEDDGEEKYRVTPNGAIVASELKSDILSSILDKSLAAALRYIDFKKRGVVVCRYEYLVAVVLYNKAVHSERGKIDAVKRFFGEIF